MRDLKYLNALNTVPGIGPATLRTLKSHFGTFEQAWTADESSLKESGVAGKAIEKLLWRRPSIHPDREMEKLIREQIWTITEEDDLFPSLLREISHSPVLLYGKGDLKRLEAENKTALGVVGTRKPTAYGREVAQFLVRDLVGFKIAIISGLAFGIDALAHEAALDAGGFTAAVLGSGVDQNSIYPSENRGLCHRIIQNGGITLSEYAPGTPAVKEHFPQRNRIISGLSRGILVIEAKEKSGALITARFALDQNREVLAVPGSIFSTSSRGPNNLVQQGAKLVQSAEDVLEELGIDYTKNQSSILDLQSKGDGGVILDFLEEPLDIDELKERTGLDASYIVTALSLLELKGLIRNLGQDIYQKV